MRAAPRIVSIQAALEEQKGGLIKVKKRAAPAEDIWLAPAYNTRYVREPCMCTIMQKSTCAKLHTAMRAWLSKCAVDSSFKLSS